VEKGKEGAEIRDLSAVELEPYTVVAYLATYKE